MKFKTSSACPLTLTFLQDLISSRFSSNKISVFGDSFAFCRYVNDDETWENFLEKKIKSNVYNYGVGNYGIDQSFLKYIQ